MTLQVFNKKMTTLRKLISVSFFLSFFLLSNRVYADEKLPMDILVDYSYYFNTSFNLSTSFNDDIHALELNNSINIDYLYIYKNRFVINGLVNLSGAPISTESVIKSLFIRFPISTNFLFSLGKIPTSFGHHQVWSAINFFSEYYFYTLKESSNFI